MWLRADNVLIDLSQYLAFYAKETEQEEGTPPPPKRKSWSIVGHTLKGEVFLLGYASSEREAREILDTFYEGLSIE